MIFLKILFLLLSYLIGAIPFGFLIGKMKGVDIRNFGSKNIGATNTGRVLGRKYAFLAFFLDTLKGALFTFLFRFGIISSEYLVLSPALYGFLAVLGHTFPVYLNFKGGKAVATSGGLILGYCPWLLVIVVLIFSITLLITKMVSIGSLVASFSALVGTLILYFVKKDPIFNLDIDIYFFIFAFLATAIIFIRHKQNIKRIIEKSESKVNI